MPSADTRFTRERYVVVRFSEGACAILSVSYCGDTTGKHLEATLVPAQYVISAPPGSAQSCHARQAKIMDHCK